MSASRSSSTRTITAVAVCIVAVGALVWSASRGNSTSGGGKYFYDLQTGQLFVSNSNETAPIAAPSGGQGALATVVSCGNCDDETSRVTAYVLKWPADALPYIGKDASQVPADVIMDPVVAKPGSDNWTRLNSSEGQQLITATVQALQEKCPSTFTACSP